MQTPIRPGAARLFTHGGRWLLTAVLAALAAACVAAGVVHLNSRLAGAPPGLRLDEGIAISDNGAIVARGSTGLVLLVPANPSDR